MADEGSKAPTSDPLKRATEILVENSSVSLLRTRFDKYPRYVVLQSQSIFDSLVSLYAQLFALHWRHLGKLIEALEPTIPAGTTAQVFAARAYISMWFVDLYVTNRKAIRKVITVPFCEHYQTQLVGVSGEYDTYLVLLNASIRPTHVRATDDALYLPVIAETVDVSNNQANPFGIYNFSCDHNLFYGLTHIMKRKNCLKMAPLSSSDAPGRPCWLFDWHSDYRVCSWFTKDGNFDMEDVTLAYILGAACTPNLAPRDVDDWQLFPDGNKPDSINKADYQRAHPRHFYGAYEVRTIEVDANYVPTTKTTGNDRGKGVKRLKPAAGVSDEALVVDTVARYRIIDWTYCYLVVLRWSEDTRIHAIQTISSVSSY